MAPTRSEDSKFHLGVIPAKAVIHLLFDLPAKINMDSRLRGNDDSRGLLKGP